MLDWRQVVSKQMGGIHLPENDAAEVVEELADHLEETYQSFLSQGIAEEAATQMVLRRAGDWRELQKGIESSRKKELQMNKRVLQFWFPAFLTVLLAMVGLMAIEMLGPKPWVSSAGPLRVTPVAVIYFAWIATLPFIGALGAWLSTRAGAAPHVVFSSILFPVLPYLGFFAIGLPIAILLGDKVAHNIMLPAFFVGFGAWVMLPAIALLVGGMPVQFLSGRLRTGN